MKRRDLLYQLAWSVPASVLLPQLLASCKKTSELYPDKKFEGSVAVIGAGAAGLYAAYLLKEKGAQVTIYEAGEQVGGRLFAVNNLTDFPVEGGASEIYGKKSLYTEFLRSLGDTGTDHPAPAAYPSGLSSRLQGLPQQVLTSRSLISVLTTRFTGLVGSIKLQSKVESVDYSGAKVKITLSDGSTSEFDKVVVTVPAPVLKAGGISFTPALPAGKIGTLAGLTGMPALKIIWKFTENFWGTAYAIPGSGDFERFEAPGSIRGRENLVLTGTVYGDKALELSQLYNNGNGENIAYTKMLEALNSQFGNNAATAATGSKNGINATYIIKDWIGDSNFGGAFAYSDQGVDRAALAAPVGTSLFFAGEATAPNELHGSIQGALDSAVVAVNHIYETL